MSLTINPNLMAMPITSENGDDASSAATSGQDARSNLRQIDRAEIKPLADSTAQSSGTPEAAAATAAAAPEQTTGNLVNLMNHGPGLSEDTSTAKRIMDALGEPNPNAQNQLNQMNLGSANGATADRMLTMQDDQSLLRMRNTQETLSMLNQNAMKNAASTSAFVTSLFDRRG